MAVTGTVGVTVRVSTAGGVAPQRHWWGQTWGVLLSGGCAGIGVCWCTICKRWYPHLHLVLTAQLW